MIDLIKEVFGSGFVQTLLIAAITAFAANFFRSKGKLVWSVSHQHLYRIPSLIDDGEYPVRTQQIWFQNIGRLPIDDIEIILNWRPQHFEIWDPRQYTLSTLPDGRLALHFPTLNSNEFFRLSMIDTINDLPIVLNVRWRGGVGKQIAMAPHQIFSPWIIWGLRFLIIAGATALIFLALQAVLLIATNHI